MTHVAVCAYAVLEKIAQALHEVTDVILKGERPDFLLAAAPQVSCTRAQD